jgi:hypothetical protein
LGFDLNNIGNDLILDRNTFVENMNQSIKSCKIFKDTIDCEFLFGVKSKNIKSVKAFIGFINSIFKNWGIYVKFNKKQIRNRDRIYILSYSLNFYHEINKYL